MVVQLCETGGHSPSRGHGGALHACFFLPAGCRNSKRKSGQPASDLKAERPQCHRFSVTGNKLAGLSGWGRRFSYREMRTPPSTPSENAQVSPAESLKADHPAISLLRSKRPRAGHSYLSRLLSGISLIGTFGTWLACASFLTIPVIPSASAQTPPTPPRTFNVKDYSAKGDGVTDDTDAIQNAINAACLATSSTVASSALVNGAFEGSGIVVIPAGRYLITRRLLLTPNHNNVVIMGSSGGSYGGGEGSVSGAKRAKTQIIWGGAGGTMIDTYGVFGLRLQDICLNGRGQADVLLSCNSIDTGGSSSQYIPAFGARGGDQWFIERVVFENPRPSTGIGFACGTSSSTCAGDFTIIDADFENCPIGFFTAEHQNLNYNFIRPQICQCGIGLYFKAGGSVTCTLLSGYSCGVCIQIDKGGINAGTFNFIGTRVETRTWNNKRTQLLKASGVVNVKFSSLLITGQGVINNGAVDYSPMFVLSNGAHVFVDSSILSGTVANLTGAAGQAATWIQFDNCRFAYLSDFRNTLNYTTPVITYDPARSGYEIRNCLVTTDYWNGSYHSGPGVAFIRSLVNLPTVTNGQ